MRVKSYYAATVEAAMASASKEMGPDAVLITSRRSGIDAQHLGAYEVVFGTTADIPDSSPSRSDASSPANTSELNELRAEMAEMRRALVSACRSANSRHWIPELGHADSIMTEAGIQPELKDEILGAVDARLRAEVLYDQARSVSVPSRKTRMRNAESNYLGAEARVLPLLREQFSALLEVAPQLEPKQGSRSVIALAGPSGAGKTSTIVKLAIQYGLAERRSVLIVSADSYRVGATEQLRVYSAAIGVAFDVADSALALRQILEEHASKHLILIDTAGAAPSDMDMNADIARFLSRHPEVETQLVLPVTAGASALSSAAKRFECFGAKKAILTKFDEAETFGAAVGQVILSNLQVSFVTNGQQIPDDLRAADKDTLLSFLSEATIGRAVSAA